MDVQDVETLRQLVRSSPHAWGGLVASLVMIYLMARIGTWLAVTGTAWPLRRDRDLSWVERARLGWTPRRLGTLAWIVFGLTGYWLFAGMSRPLQLLPQGIILLLSVTISLAAVVRTRLAFEPRLNPAFALTPAPRRAVWISSLLVVLPLILMPTLISALLPGRLDATALALLAALVLGVGLHLGGGWIRGLRVLGVIRPASERLREVGERTAAAQGIVPRDVEQVGLPMANALAFVVDRKIGVTDAALAVLDDEELAAVCAHEVGHLSESKWIIASRLSIGFVLGLFLAILEGSVGPVAGSYGPEAMLMGLIAAPCVLILGLAFSRRIARRMEHRADAHAAGSQAAPGVYARALEKLYRTNLAPAVMRSKKMVHPHLYDRMVEAGVTPDYPRPAPPPRWQGLTGLAIVLLSAAAGVLAHRWIGEELPRRLFHPPEATMWRIGAGRELAGDPRTLRGGERGDWLSEPDRIPRPARP